MDDKVLNDKYQKSGFNAEKKMGFYLKRAYETDEYLFVINDLRLEIGNDHAQIDHLIVHKFGFIIIESKSVSSKVSVNKYSEWKRTYNGVESGMPSPIQQAKRQVEFLKRFLKEKDSSEIFRENFANKYLAPSIEKFKYDILVAISDSGIIERDSIELNEICKADVITERIDNIISIYQRQASKILSMKLPNQFHKNSLEKLSNLLVSSHCPICIPKESHIVNKEDKVITKTQKVCNECKSNNIQILYGKYGYYYKCQDCNKNSKVILTCNKQSCKPKLKKEKEKFYKVCQDCNIKELFFINR